MAIRTRKVGEVCGAEIVVIGSGASDFAVILTNFEDVSDPADECRWLIELVIGAGADARRVKIDIARFISASDYAKSNTEPILLSAQSTQGKNDVVFFRGRFFLPERAVYSEADKHEVILR
jgi:hypothetical protein